MLHRYKRDGNTPLKVGAGLAKGWKDDEFAGAGDDRLVFELPGMLMRDIDGVQADLHGGIDVAARAVADHPPVRLYNLMFLDQRPIRFRALLRNDLDKFEETLES